MNLTIDIGNTRIKCDLFDADAHVKGWVVDEINEALLMTLNVSYPIQGVIVSSVRGDDEALQKVLQKQFERFIILNHHTSLPIKIAYQNAETLGKDRVAALVGAWSIKPHAASLVIDMGTCITFDYLSSEGIFKGGNIAPGWNMRLEAMHGYTHVLPLAKKEVPEHYLGNNTLEALMGGAYFGIVNEVEGYINKLKLKRPDIHIFLTGGDGIHFEKQIKNCIFAVPNLVPIGLNQILIHNESIGKII